MPWCLRSSARTRVTETRSRHRYGKGKRPARHTKGFMHAALHKHIQRSGRWMPTSHLPHTRHARRILRQLLLIHRKPPRVETPCATHKRTPCTRLCGVCSNSFATTFPLLLLCLLCCKRRCLCVCCVFLHVMLELAPRAHLVRFVALSRSHPHTVHFHVFFGMLCLATSAIALGGA